MKLVRIGRVLWDVLATADEKGECGVLEALQDKNVSNVSARNKMLGLLRVHVPASGPPIGTDKCSPLSGQKGLFEFRCQPTRGPKLRVIYFNDKGKVVVCTGAFEKRKRTPPSEIRRAKALMVKYFVDKEQGKLEIDDPEEQKNDVS